MMIARVVVDKGPGQALDYAVPEALSARIVPGTRVTVPLGRRIVSGTVQAVCSSSAHAELREVLSVSDRPSATLTPSLMRLAEWMARYYCAPAPAVYRAMLPAPVRRAEGEGMQRLFVVPLEQAGTAGRSVQGDVPVRSPSIQNVPALTPRRREVLEALRLTAGGWLSDITRATGASPALLRALDTGGFVRIESRRFQSDPLGNRNILPSLPPPLMPEQTAALESLRAVCAPDATDHRPVLLFGVTGSGKTEIYLQTIASVLENGRGAIVLVPEIALTPQTVQRFIARFGDTVAVLHSAMSGGDRQAAWRRIHEGGARVVIGPRSAVFAPVRPLGLIVVDEAHEPSYKQDEAPRYHARDVAVMRAHIENCGVVLGTATPSLESWRNAQLGKYRLALLSRRVDNRRMPRIRVVDMRRETARSGRMPVFSQPLVEAVAGRIERGEQVLLFLNRRGYSSALVCPVCGHVEACSDCSVSLTYHRHDERLRCHICGAARTVPGSCPNCADPAFRYAGIGTQRIENIARALFPRARIQRMDADVTTQRGSHERILAAFRARSTDILIGTQMIAKGLDFPNVTLVGVLAADLSLHMPDFRAGERTFQLLAQVAGRAGRGVVPGEVIVQTCTPRHRAVEAARRNDFEGFARAELEDRRALSYPPFGRLACVTFRGEREASVSECAELTGRALRSALGRSATVSDPVPAPLARAKKRFRYQVLLRGASSQRLADTLRDVLEHNRPPSAVQVAVDIDALNLM